MSALSRPPGRRSLAANKTCVRLWGVRRSSRAAVSVPLRPGAGSGSGCGVELLDDGADVVPPEGRQLRREGGNQE